MISYEINVNTYALLPIDDKKTIAIEKDGNIVVLKNATQIIKESCENFGSSYDGRYNGTKKLLGVSYKSPIIIEETKKIIYFPTTSPRLNTCAWINLNSIKNYDYKNEKVKVYFFNNKIIDLDISFQSFDRQVLRASRLELILQKRINNFYN